MVTGKELEEIKIAWDKVKVFTIDKAPKNYLWRNDDKGDVICFSDELENQSLEDIVPDAIFYWYIRGDYEGSGALLATKDGKWYAKDLSHCSCYGPIENFAKNLSEYDEGSLYEIESRLSDDYKNEFGPLIELARRHEYK